MTIKGPAGDFFFHFFIFFHFILFSIISHTHKKKKENFFCGRPIGHHFSHPLDRKRLFFMDSLRPNTRTVSSVSACHGHDLWFIYYFVVPSPSPLTLCLAVKWQDNTSIFKLEVYDYHAIISRGRVAKFKCPRVLDDPPKKLGQPKFEAWLSS